MMNPPLVSVLMTAYNRQKYIAEAIESVLASTYTNFELIIVDDCSSDNTVLIAQSYVAKDNRVKLFVNEKNLGDYPNRNRAAGYARGEYIKYVDSDDKMYPGGLEYCIECMQHFKNAEWAIIYPIEIQQEFLFSPAHAILWHFFKEPFLKAGPGATIIRKDFFLKIGMYPTAYGPASDMYFNLQAASMGNVLVLKDIFLFYRRHNEQEQSNRFSYLYNNCKYLKDALENLKLPLTDKQITWLQNKRKRRFAVNISKYFFRTGNLFKTMEAIKKAEFSMKDFIVGLFHFNRNPGKHLNLNMDSSQPVVNRNRDC